MRLFTLFIILTTIAGCSEVKPTAEPFIRPIAWLKVETTNFEQIRRLSGIIVPVEKANLSFAVSGKVDLVNVELGEKVTQGQALAQLDQRDFKLNLESAQASLAQAQARMTEAENEFQRYSELVKQGVVSKSGYDNAKTAYDTATSATNVAKAQLEIAKKRLQDSTLLSPYDGVITKRTIEPSQQISVGQTLFQIEGEHGLEVRIMVPENLIQQLTRNTELPINFPALPTLTIPGVITEIGTQAESANAFPVTVLLKGIDQRLRAGMTAEADFTIAGIGRTGFTGNTGIKVPVSALGAGEGQTTYTYVYNPETETLNKRDVQTENIINNEVYISSGLKEGEIIAIAGITFLRDNQKVSLLDPTVKRFNQ